MDANSELLRLAESIFDLPAEPEDTEEHDTETPETDGSKNDNLTKPHTASTPLYPEFILQITDKANMFHTRFQRTTPQFIDSHSGGLVRWKKSSIEELQRAVVEQLFIGASSSAKRSNYNRNAATTLFSWSSSDEYIEARKRELKLKGRSVEEKKDVETVPEGSLITKVNLKVLPQSVVSELNQVVEREANVFIHDRIQVIKAHHSEQISHMISERKRKDHELHLQRVRQKEEEYERELRSATEERDKTSFFGSLFGGANTRVTGSPAPSLSQDTSSDKNKRFSFLPGSLFNSTRPNTETSSKSIDIRGHTPTKSIDSQSSKKGQKQDMPKTIAAADLDLVFQAPKDISDDDEFDDFTTAPPESPPKANRINRPFLAMAEPPPLINFDSEPRKSNDDLLAL